MKKSVSLLMAMVFTIGLLVSAVVAANADWIMYNAASNGKGLNVREYPSTDAPKLGSIPYGGSVSIRMTSANGWACIDWKGDVGYVMTRFLSDQKPSGKPAQTPEEKEKESEEAKLKKEQASERAVAEPFYIAVVATRASGRINFRSGPSKITKRVASYNDGEQLIVIGETDNWYRARDPRNDKVGYIHKNFTVRMEKPVELVATGDGKEKLGSLSVNGKFDLTCKLPENYSLQVVNVRGSSITAAVQPDDMTKPILMLNIAYDETYSDVERMNDLSEEELKILEATFSDLDAVDISYAETGYGTKLLIARENDGDGDTEFVEILTIYKGYFIEFDMEPNEDAAERTLTDEQIQMCIDFLTNVDFNEVK